MNDLPKKTLLRPDEVARYLGVSRSVIYAWVDLGLLAAEQYVPGGTIRIPRQAVLDFRRAREKTPLE
jgi:excisionase family DNA binding protein